jgi:hypothetical protein
MTCRLLSSAESRLLHHPKARRGVTSISRILLSVAIALACQPLAQSEKTTQERTIAQLRSAAAKLAPLHTKKTPAGPGDWLANNRETGQTSAQYRRSNPNRPSSKRTTIYVQPIGEFNAAQKRVVGETAEILSRFYGVPTKVLDPLGLDLIPAKARRVEEGEPQILTTYVLDNVLKPRRPDDAVAVLGLTTVDLWPGKGWNYLLGKPVSRTGWESGRWPAMAISRGAQRSLGLPLDERIRSPCTKRATCWALPTARLTSA